MNIYIAGPMRGIPDFNFPAFGRAAAELRSQGMTVFSPAERDLERHNGVDIGNPTGSLEQAEQEHNFSLRDALGDDMAWICKNANAVYLLKGWENSYGAKAEKALAEALGLEIYYES